jgi:hypothetical protein
VDLAERVEPEHELGHDAEIAATAAERPQQVRVTALTRLNGRAVRRHDGRTDEVVARQPARPHQEADPAGQRQSADPGVDERATRNVEPVRDGRAVDVLPQRSTLRECEPALRVDRHAPHPAQVDDERILRKRLPGDAVASATDRDR